MIRRNIALQGALALLFCLGVVVSWTARQPNESYMLPYSVNRLSRHIQQLEASFNQPADSSAAAAYVRTLKDIDQDCRNIAAIDPQPSADTQEWQDLLSKSRLLCKDLMPLLTETHHIYASTLPLLGASTAPQRYQTIPLIKERIRKGHAQSADQALAALQNANQASHNEVVFPTRAPLLLTELKAAMQRSDGLSYLPALQSFRLQLLDERQQFWTAYADINGIKTSLMGIQKDYCQAPGLSPAQRRLCQAT